jgi:tetrapyrrole methylase family protein/MazG family protein
MTDPVRRFERLMEVLRSPGGCPWDREQTPETLRSYVIEEAFEVVEAIDSGDPRALREELGDLLLQVVFLSQIAKERGWFDLDGVATAIADKMERRHPHVFAQESAATATEVSAQWQALKAKEGRRLLSGVPRALPALTRSLRVTEKAATVGFDWTDPDRVLDKVEEELGELRQALRAGELAHVEAELGDLLFALANFGRHCRVDPEAALRGTVERFTSRFAFIEDAVLAQGRNLQDADLEEMEALWAEAKRQEAKRAEEEGKERLAVGREP